MHPSMNLSYQTFKNHVAEWAKTHEGQYVVVRNQDFIWPPYPDYGSALEAGYSRYSLESFFVKKIEAVETIHYHNPRGRQLLMYTPWYRTVWYWLRKFKLPVLLTLFMLVGRCLITPRLDGVPDPNLTFEAVAHMLVGGMFASWWVYRSFPDMYGFRDRVNAYWYLAWTVSLFELFMFLVQKGGLL